MSKEYFWLTMTIYMTAIFWLPYVLNSIFVRGLLPSMGYKESSNTPLADWAERAKLAHYNAIENLVIFAPLVIIANLQHIEAQVTICASCVYFWARLTHYFSYTFYPFPLRTLSFFVGVGAQLTLILHILGWV